VNLSSETRGDRRLGEAAVNNALKRLQDLLNELFQIEDAADLNFGIYRIMKHKRAEVMAFVDKRLPEIVDEALEGGALARLSAQAEERRQVTDQIRENFGEYAIGPSGELMEAFHATPLGKRYLALPPEAPEAGSEQLDVSIFNHLYTFFSRYYDGATSFPSSTTPGARSTQSRTTVRKSTFTGRTPTSTMSRAEATSSTTAMRPRTESRSASRSSRPT
jgi:hypothetical protein